MIIKPVSTMIFVKVRTPDIFSSINLLFILTDVFTALVLGKLGAHVAKALLKDQKKEISKYHEVKFTKPSHFKVIV